MAAKHSYNSGRISRAGAGGAPARRRAPKRKKKSGAGRIVKWVSLILVILVVGVAAIGALYVGLKKDDWFDPGATGTIEAESYTPKEYRGDVINILIVGIYHEEGEVRPEGLGLTDMILYVNYDLKNNRMNILQIPRDSYPGEAVPTGGSGKINAAMVSGENQTDPINNLVTVINKQYGLPVDRYICVDMESLKEIVDILGPIMVYVPQEMRYDGNYLAQGWQPMTSEQVEFFVRNRKGVGFERADIDRLDNQRYFYSALFRRFLNLTARDITRLIPVFEYRCTTDIKLTDMFDLAYTALNLSAEDVLFCKVPGATRIEDVWEADPTGSRRDIYIVDVWGRGTEEDPGLATLLNTYFREYGDPVSAQELVDRGLPNVQIPGGITLYPPNVQQMGEIQETEGGADIDVEIRN